MKNYLQKVGPSITLIVPNITTLLRANVKMFAEMCIDTDNFDSDHIDLVLGLGFAF